MPRGDDPPNRLTDQQHDWATGFTHIDTRVADASRDEPTRRKPGKVIRVERTRGLTDAEWKKWQEQHPNAKQVDGANLVDGKRTEDPKFSQRSLRGRGFYFAKVVRSDEMKQAWEDWFNDEGDGSVIVVFVPY